MKYLKAAFNFLQPSSQINAAKADRNSALVLILSYISAFVCVFVKTNIHQCHNTEVALFMVVKTVFVA